MTTNTSTLLSFMRFSCAKIGRLAPPRNGKYADGARNDVSGHPAALDEPRGSAMMP